MLRRKCDTTQKQKYRKKYKSMSVEVISEVERFSLRYHLTTLLQEAKGRA
jgi:hypothetical protein